MKRVFGDIACCLLLGGAGLAVALLTGCTVEGGTSNRSSDEAHGTHHSGSRIEIQTTSGGS